MATSAYVDRYRYWRYSAFKWRTDLSITQKVALALGMACLTGLVAQLRIHLWFTPVPVTGQVFAVLLSGVLLGARYGFLSQAFYVGIGACGIPWFQGWAGGIGYLSNTVTLGYLLAFMVVPILIGALSETFITARGFLPQLGLMLIAVVIIDLAGTAYLGSFLHKDFHQAMKLGFWPFIPWDLAKAAAVAGISATLLPKASYGREVDSSRYTASY
ncbi:MAG: biotin transporter BioY [Chloroflexi bacterium]|nr:biotin transporter BioY [Chloroflexota bacterium]